MGFVGPGLASVAADLFLARIVLDEVTAQFLGERDVAKTLAKTGENGRLWDFFCNDRGGSL